VGTTEVGNTLGGKSGKMGSIRMGVYTGMGRRQNRWIPIQLLLQILLLLAVYSTNAQIAYVLLMLVACSNPPFISNKEN